MRAEEILSHCDLTTLRPEATEDEILALCDKGMKYGVASVCIPPAYVAAAKRYVGEGLKICTVVGFPLGYSSTFVKVFETQDAILSGADEIDMVINIGEVKRNNYDYVKEEIEAVRRAAKDKTLKVIIETCLLTDEEKVILCRIISEAGADYIKTSTGFSHSGAKIEDIKLFGQHVAAGVKIKAAGGISTFREAYDFISAGADRVGTSKILTSADGAEYGFEA
jgi:deoxyribose-phosphate aldolase